MKRKTTAYKEGAICAMFRKVNSLPEFIHLTSLNDISEILHTDKIVLTCINGYVVAMWDKDAKGKGLPLSLVVSHEIDGKIERFEIYGDIVITRLHPEIKALESLTYDDVKSILS